MRVIRRTTTVSVLTFVLLALLAAPALAEDEPPFYTGLNDGMTLTAMSHGQGFFPYVVVHKTAAEVQCYLRVYTVKGPTWTLVRELPIGTDTPLRTWCGAIHVEVPFSYTWSDVDLEPGGYRCKVAATDGTEWAFDDSSSCSFNVVSTPDTTPPATTTDYDGLWHSSAPATFIIWLTAEDAAGGWGLGAGQTKIEISRDGGLTWLPFYTWRLGVGFPTWKRGGGSGVRNLLYRTTDYAGNVEPTKSIDVLIDSRPPQTRDDAPLGPQAADVTVHLTAADSMVGVTACSGVSETWSSLDGGRWVEGGAVRVPAARNAGLHWIAYYSVDNAGNVESLRQCCVAIAAQDSGALAHRSLSHRQPPRSRVDR